MTDSTDCNPRLPSDAVMTASTEISLAPEQLAVPLILEGTPDSRAIAQDFLEHYESFVDGAHDHWLSWQTPPFYVEGTTVTESRVWAKAGVAGMVGLAAMTAASVLLPQDTVSAIVQVPQKLPSPAATPNSTVPVSQAALPALTAIAPAEGFPQVSSFVPAAAESTPELSIPSVISPTLRSPWPAGQVIGQQQPSGVETSLSQTQLALAQLPQLKLPQAKLSPTQLPQPELPQPELSPTQLPQPKLSQTELLPAKLPQPESNRGIDASLAIGMPQEMPLPEWSRAPALNASQSPAPEKPAPEKPATSTALPSPSASSPPPSWPTSDLSLASPILPIPSNQSLSPDPSKAVATSGVQPTPAAAMELSRPSVPIVSEFTETNLTKASKQSSSTSKQPGMFLGNPSAPVNQAIATAETLQDFLNLSRQIPENTPVVISLTSQAARTVANAATGPNPSAVLSAQTESSAQTKFGDPRLQSFQIFRLPAAVYEKAWIALTQANGQSDVPVHGFIDYQERAIVLPSL
jgi:hypothetical protein